MNYYNNYTNPYGRNYGVPNYTQTQYAMQPQQMAQPQQQPMQYETPIQYVGYANLKEAEAHILFPNQKAMFIDNANGMVYEKVCGNDGQSYITHFKKIEDKEDKKEQPQIDLSNYVKKEDLGDFVGKKQYNELLSKFEQLQKQFMVVKNNGSKQ